MRQCIICGKPAVGKHAFYCKEHGKVFSKVFVARRSPITPDKREGRK